MFGSFGRACAALLFLSATSSSALAVCDYCNPTVRFDSVTAECFVGQVEADISRIKSEGRGFLLVDLTNCVAAKGRGLPDAAATIATPAPVDTSFVADEAGLLCLREELLSADRAALDPSTEIDLSICS